MYIFVNEELDMTRGKLGAQTGHAAVEAYELSKERDFELVNKWRLGGHYTKLIMSARNFDHLCVIERYLNDRGFETAMIIDEGRTEVAPLSATALGVEIVDRDDPHAKATFSAFETLKDSKPRERRKLGDIEEPELSGTETVGTWPLPEAVVEFVSKVGQDPNVSIDTLLEIRKLFLRR